MFVTDCPKPLAAIGFWPNTTKPPPRPYV